LRPPLTGADQSLRPPLTGADQSLRPPITGADQSLRPPLTGADQRREGKHNFMAYWLSRQIECGNEN